MSIIRTTRTKKRKLKTMKPMNENILIAPHAVLWYLIQGQKKSIAENGKALNVKLIIATFITFNLTP